MSESGTEFEPAPDEFQEDALSCVVDFAGRYGGDYGSLCMHAAIPLGLTPELLHLIRYNFVNEVPAIAEADLLLSRLCLDVGGGYYQMRSDVRELLIFELKNDAEFGKSRVESIAELMLGYADRKWRVTDDQELRSFLLAQRWTALAYLDPAEAARQLAGALGGQMNGLQQTDAMQVAVIAQELSEPLQSEEEVLLYAAGVENLARGQMKASARFFKALGDTSSPVNVGDVQLPAPDELISQEPEIDWRDADTLSMDYERVTDSQIEIAMRDPRSILAGSALQDYSFDREPLKGGFSLVYKARTPEGKTVALRFWRNVTGVFLLRYQDISYHLRNNYPDALIPFRICNPVLAIEGVGVPVVEMDWVDGVNLYEWVGRRCQENNQSELKRMADHWVEQMGQLHAAQVAHGDLQPKNILINKHGHLKLVDYDMLVVPKRVGEPVREIGVAPYQHPGRNAASPGEMSLDIDNFSCILIYVCLEVFANDPTCWQTFVESPRNNRLLFQQSDLDDPQESKLCQALLKSKSERIATLTTELIKLYNGPIEAVPRLESFLLASLSGEEDPSPKTPSKKASKSEPKKHPSLSDAIKELERIHGVKIDSEAKSSSSIVTEQYTGVALNTALRVLLGPRNMTAKVDGKPVVFSAKNPNDNRIAILSDIGGNLEALDAVLSDIEKQGITQIYCLGDMAGSCANPIECINACMTFDICLVGDVDQGLLFDPEGFNSAAERALFWGRNQLEEPLVGSDGLDNRWEFLGELPRSHKKDELLFVHGSPRNPINEYVFPEDVYDQRKMERIFSLISKLCFAGHTRVPGIFTESSRFYSPAEINEKYQVKDEKVLVNVGSVGMPSDNDSRATYVVYDGKTITFRKLQYNVEQTATKILKVPELSDQFADELRKGNFQEDQVLPDTDTIVQPKSDLGFGDVKKPKADLPDTRRYDPDADELSDEEDSF